MRSPLLLAALLALAAMAPSALAAAEGCANICKDVTINDVPGCSLPGKACKCVALFKHDEFKLDLTDPVSGAQGHSDYRGSEHDAGMYAFLDLFSHDRGCNCHPLPDVPFKNCTFAGSACLYFASGANFDAKIASFKVFLHEKNQTAIEVEADAATQQDVGAAVMSDVAALQQKGIVC